MQAQGLIDVEHDRVRDDSQPVTHPLHGDRSDLLSLRLGVAIEPRLRGWKQDLERVHAFDVRCHGNHRDDAATQAPRCRVGRVVADDYRSLHSHTEPEAFYVLEGDFTPYGSDGQTRLTPGSFVLIKPGEVHGFRAGEDGGRFLAIWPAKMDGYFEAMISQARAGSASPQAMAEIGHRHGVTGHGVLARRIARPSFSSSPSSRGLSAASTARRSRKPVSSGQNVYVEADAAGQSTRSAWVVRDWADATADGSVPVFGEPLVREPPGSFRAVEPSTESPCFSGPATP